MKQFVFLLSLSTLLIASACSKSEDEKSTLDKTSITLNKDKTIQLNVSTGNNSINWSCEDEYVASVSNSGLVTGNRVGKTIVTANDLKCQVIVDPIYNLYEEPVLDWNMTKSQIVSKLGTPYSSTSTTIIYETKNSKAPLIMYTFDTNGKLKGSYVTVMSNYVTECSDFLLERYAVWDISSGSNIIALFGNSLDTKKATVIVGIQVESRYIGVVYIPNNSTKSANVEISNDVKELIEQYLNQ